MIEGVEFGALLADKAFDSDWIITELNKRGAQIVISQHPRRSAPIAIDMELYKARHLIENFFGKLKEFKRIALRADKTDQSFTAMIRLAAALSKSATTSSNKPNEKLLQRLRIRYRGIGFRSRGDEA